MRVMDKNSQIFDMKKKRKSMGVIENVNLQYKIFKIYSKIKILSFLFSLTMKRKTIWSIGCTNQGKQTIIKMKLNIYIIPIRKSQNTILTEAQKKQIQRMKNDPSHYSNDNEEDEGFEGSFTGEIQNASLSFHNSD